jgi:hypothetical protein
MGTRMTRIMRMNADSEHRYTEIKRGKDKSEASVHLSSSSLKLKPCVSVFKKKICVNPR